MSKVTSLTLGNFTKTTKRFKPRLTKSFFHSSVNNRFPLSDYNVFWLRQPRLWEFIEYANHPPMNPTQKVKNIELTQIYGKQVNNKARVRRFGTDTFWKPFQTPPWINQKIRQKVPCVLKKCDGSVIDFTLSRSLAERIGNSLRAKNTLFDLKLSLRDFNRMKTEKFIDSSIKNISSDIIKINELKYEINGNIENLLKYKNYNVFLRDMDRRYIFDEIEILYFEEYNLGESTTIIVPIRFWGLDQWFPMDLHTGVTWNAPKDMERPKYVQHCHEIEFKWIGTNDLSNINIPDHISITVEQFCLPWKLEITLADVNLPDNIIPLKPPHEIKILSLDWSHAYKDVEIDEEEIELRKQIGKLEAETKQKSKKDKKKK